MKPKNPDELASYEKNDENLPDTLHVLGTRVRVVAEMPVDDGLQEELEQMKKQDGYPGSCGI